MTKRNIVLITIDSLRADHCSFMGYHRKTTPTLDKMAKRGLYFKNAIAASVPTPTSIYSIFCADYPIIFSKFLHKELKKLFLKRRTIAEVLSKKGYTTIAFNQNPYIPPEIGYGKGFSILKGYSESKVHKLLYHIFRVNRDMADLILANGICRNSEKIYEDIIEVLEKVTRPYFLWIILLDTHVPYLPSKRKYSKLIDNYYINYKLRKMKWRGKLSPNEQQKLINAYDDCILNADEFIKKLMKDLEGDDPIFIIHADHGDGFGEHGFYHHPPALYEELIHVPLVIYNIDIRGKIRKPVSLLGLSPLILELIGEKNEFPYPSLLNDEKEWVISKVFSNGNRMIAVRMEEWKYIEGQKEEGELYNLKKDPTEQENLINDYPDLVKEFKTIIRNHIKEEELIRIRYHLKKILSN